MDLNPSKITLKHDLRALPYIFPFLAIFAVFIGYPLFYSVWISLHRVTIYSDFYDLFGTMDFVGVDNYAQLVRDPVFWWSIFLTFVYSVLTIVPGMALSLALALLLNRQIRGFGLLRSGFYLPNVFDLYVVGVIWLLIYNPGGGLFTSVLLWFSGFVDPVLLKTLGGARVGTVDMSGVLRGPVEIFARTGILNNPYTTLPAIAFTMILKNAGFGMILFLTSLNSINQSIFEAADVDGASARQKLFLITLPMLRPIILFLTITGLMGTLNAFAEIYAMTDDTGGTSVNVAGVTLQSARISGYHLYKNFDQSMYGEAAAISFMLLLIALVISFLNYKVLSPRD